MTNSEILVFIYDRLVHVHGERENYDYMLRFRRAIGEVIDEPVLMFPDFMDEDEVVYLLELRKLFMGKLSVLKKDLYSVSRDDSEVVHAEIGQLRGRIKKIDQLIWEDSERRIKVFDKKYMEKE